MATKKKPKEPIHGDTFKKALPVKIDEKMAHKKESEIRALLTENVLLKEKAKPFNDKRKLNSERVEELREEVESLTEEREVKCHLEYDFARREVHTRRLDTNTIVKELSRTMQDSDRQETLLSNRKDQKATKQRPAKNPKFQAAVDASDAAAAHAAGYNDPAEGAEEANA